MKRALIFFFSVCCLLSLAAQTPTQLKEWLPVVDGWTVSDKVEVFAPHNLFDRINGSAPLFIENNFREMTAFEYLNGDNYITIQAYRHASAEDAFGMYASERSPDMPFHAIGGEAQGDDTNLYFFAGHMYVKMWANGADIPGTVLTQIAAALADAIDAEASYPQLLRLFPEEGRQPHTEAYITSNYLGHTFLNGVYTTNYVLGDETFQVFVIDAQTEDGAREMLNKYFEFTRQSKEFTPGKLLIADRYNGDIPMLWKGRYVLGVFSENGNEITCADDFLDALAEKL